MIRALRLRLAMWIAPPQGTSLNGRRHYFGTLMVEEGKVVRETDLRGEAYCLADSMVREIVGDAIEDVVPDCSATMSVANSQCEMRMGDEVILEATEPKMSDA